MVSKDGLEISPTLMQGVQILRKKFGPQSLKCRTQVHQPIRERRIKSVQRPDFISSHQAETMFSDGLLKSYSSFSHREIIRYGRSDL